LFGGLVRRIIHGEPSEDSPPTLHDRLTEAQVEFILFAVQKCTHLLHHVTINGNMVMTMLKSPELQTGDTSPQIFNPELRTKHYNTKP